MSGNYNVMKDLSKFIISNFSDISKIFTNTIKIIYLEIYNEVAIQHHF